MLNFPFVSAFMFIMFFSSIFSLCSAHWFGAWLGLEMNLMSFIPIMVQKGSMEEVESAIKYFLTQAVASGLLLLAASVMFWSEGSWDMVGNSFLSKNIILMTLLLKMGVAPFHFWLPSVAAGLSWMCNMLLMTWQKVAPLFLICFFFFISFPQVLLLVLMSSFFGGVGGINQTSIRSLLAYSSILHNGWMLAASLISTEVVLVYFLLYSFILISVLFLFLTEEIKNNMQFFSIFLWKDFSRSYLSLMILSLGGMPPLLGFFSKWLVVSKLVLSQFVLIPFILILGAMISLYYYLVLSFSVILSHNLVWKSIKILSLPILSFMLTMNFSGIFFISLLSTYI
uniref:NADH-ubiquinone oxidoreductase chain 2 n=1 Tax=Enoplochiton echinatus TaxID=3244015 RepID=A0A6H1PGK0_9MOLL|nr:NADH dehydrogenase subunit 2 [Acanthopleura echinata]